MRRFIAYLALAAWLPSTPAHGTTIDQRPRPARLLDGGERLLAQSSMEAVTLYRADGRPVHVFPTDGPPAGLDVTAGGGRVLVAGAGGGVDLWELGSGQPVWRAGRSRTGLAGVYDAALAGDGTACVVCSYEDFAVVLDGRTGAVVGRVAFPPRQTNVMSAALAPDGRTGVLIDLGGRVFAFDVAAGAPRDTGLTGAGPIRYSADGRHVACRSSNAGSAERLRVIAVGTWTATDVGRFSHIGHIRPVAEGGFLATARVDDRAAGTAAVVGVRYSPGA